MVVWNALTELWREENRARGYEEVKTPILFDVELFKQSGHWEKYRENMYFTEVEERPMGLKPMNCPAHIQIYKDARHSYRELPVRYSEAGLVHRHEPSGRAARPAARAPHNPGRRAHLLHRGAGAGGGRGVPALRLSPV